MISLGNLEVISKKYSLGEGEILVDGISQVETLEF